MDVFTKIHVNPANSCEDISLIKKQKSQITEGSR